MADSLEDPHRKTRWLFGTAVAMLLAGFVGLMSLVSWVNDHPEAVSWSGVKEAFAPAAMGSCVSFWLIWPIMYFCYIRKSAATLEYQRTVLEAERASRERRP